MHFCFHKISTCCLIGGKHKISLLVPWVPAGEREHEMPDVRIV